MEDPRTGAPLRVVAVGDLMVGDTAISVGYGFGSRYADGIESVAARVRPLLADADLVLGNLECPLSLDGYHPHDWRAAQMRGRPSYARALRAAGFTHLSVANNHSTQHGRTAFDETVVLLREAGIEPCGLRGEEGWAARPVRTRLDGRTVCVLAYSLRPEKYHQGTPPYACATPQQVLGDVERCHAAEDVIVTLHWGEEYGDRPSAEEVRFGRALVDAGAALVLGHHPHVIRPVERHARGVIAYSLGNFVADMTWRRAFRQTLLLRCDLADPGGTLELESGWIDDDFVPTPVAGGEGIIMEGLEGLDATGYRLQTVRTERAQSLAAYAHAVRNIARFDRGVLSQLVRTTLRNKLDAVRRRG